MRTRSLACALLLAASGAAAAPAASPGCSLPDSIQGRRFTNLSDPEWRPDNPHAGRMVRVDFSADRYLLSVLGTRRRHEGTYRYRRVLPHIAVIDMHESFDSGDSRYQLLLACRSDLQGRFVFTQFDGPVAPTRRQNGGTWTLQPR